jgi:hypothetical protein
LRGRRGWTTPVDRSELAEERKRRNAGVTIPSRSNNRRIGFRPSLTAAVVALSLFLQLPFIPYHQASGATALSASQATRVAADLKAIFGDAASLCLHVDDDGAHGGTPVTHHDDECPFCRFAAEAATVVASHAPALPVCYDVAQFRIDFPAEFSAPPAAPLRRQQARAPPLAV